MKKLFTKLKLIKIGYISLICVLPLLSGVGVCSAQSVGINATGIVPNQSAMLDIVSSNKGILIPRVALTQTTSNAPIGIGIATSLMVYNTATINDVTPGYYYWDGTVWRRIQDAPAGGSNDWTILGNAGTVDGTNFIGTTDNIPFNIRVNNQKSGRIDPTSSNTAFGYLALNSNTTGNNTAYGRSALQLNTTGTSNTAIGISPLLFNTTGSNNTAIGGALSGNVSGNSNVAVGGSSLISNISGNNNTATGVSSLESTKGNGNTATGYRSLQNNVSGDNNTAVGYFALRENIMQSNLVAIGDSALFNNGLGATNPAQATLNTAIGSATLLSNTTGQRNTALGYHALYANATSAANTALGANSLLNNNGGNFNTAVGDQSLFSNTTGFENTAVGASAMLRNTTGRFNVAIGRGSFSFNTTGIQNTATGFQALLDNTTGWNNTALGVKALGNTTTGSDNTSVGSFALNGNETGSNNSALGSSSFFTGLAFSNSTALGALTVITASNQIRLGDNLITSIGGFQNWTNVSDGRFKQNIKENVSGLDFILKLRPVSYNLNYDAYAKYVGLTDSLRNINEEKIRSNDIHTGFIAQEVEQAAYDLYFDFSGIDKPKNEKDYYGLRYAEFVVPLVKAVQEQQEMINELKNENDDLKLLIANIELNYKNRIKKLEELMTLRLDR